MSWGLTVAIFIAIAVGVSLLLSLLAHIFESSSTQERQMHCLSVSYFDCSDMPYLDYKRQVQEKLSAPERKQAFAFADSFQNGQVMCGIAIGTSSNDNAITPTKQISYVLCKMDASDSKLPEDIYNAIVNCNKILYEILDVDEREPAFVDAWTAARLDVFKQEREQKIRLEQEKTKVESVEEKEPAGAVIVVEEEDAVATKKPAEHQQGKNSLHIDLPKS